MCVVIAKKVKNKITNTKKYCLFKIRDRSYNPVYSLKTYTYDNGITTLFLVDNKNQWTEGISNKLMIVSSALENHLDIGLPRNKSSKLKSIFKKINERNGIILRRALRQKDLKTALDILVETRFVGNTYISDGDKCFLIECAVTKETFDNFKNEIIDNENIDYADFKLKIMKNISKDDFEIEVKEITSDLDVRTNHSLLIKNAGYVKGERGYKSSVLRRDIVIDNLKNFNGSSEEIVKLLASLDTDKINKNPEYRPIRIKDKVDYTKKDKESMEITNYYSTDVVGLDPNGTLYLYPIYSKIKNLDMQKVLKKSGIHLIVLKPELEESLFKKALKNIQKD